VHRCNFASDSFQNVRARGNEYLEARGWENPSLVYSINARQGGLKGYISRFCEVTSLHFA